MPEAAPSQAAALVKQAPPRDSGASRRSEAPGGELRNARVRRVLWLTMGLNLVVAILKIAYGHWSHALSIRADGFHSLTDASNNIVGLLGVYLAARPPDRDHPYGHAKFEILAAGVVGLSLLAMAYDVVRNAFERALGSGEAPDIDARVFVVLVLTLGVNLWVSSYERRMGERYESSFLLSDATHTRSDVLVTLGVMLTAALVELGYPNLDIAAAFVIAAFIAWAGISVLRHNLAYLADHKAVDDEVVSAIVLRVPGVASTHKIRTRGSPGAIHVDLHIQIARHLDVVTAHQVTHWVIEAIQSGVQGVQDVVVHTEPAAVGQPYNPLPDANAASTERAGPPQSSDEGRSC
ncbi:MAG TPA: cation diffusion facilitator family transporter [Polyangiaceae bacterium]|nr:cation diffusion facilitator family transporter [Polyangiaceae bacterium]